MQVCVTLALLTGNPHQWLGGACGGIAVATVNKTLHTVVTAINLELKEEFLKFPSNMELELLAEENLEKYHLPNFAYAIGGCHFIFQEKPR